MEPLEQLLFVSARGFIVLFKSLCRNEVEAKLLEKTISSEAIAYKTEWLSIRSEGGLISARIYENHYSDLIQNISLRAYVSRYIWPALLLAKNSSLKQLR